MGDLVANISLGEVKKFAKLDAGANDAFIVGLLKAAGLQADATLRDHDTISDALAASNDEADFTNYARKTVSTLTITVDDTTDRVDIDMADLTWTAAGGGVNNTIGKLFVAHDPDTTAGTDTTLTPQTYHDFSITTAGSDITALVAAGGFYRSQG